MDPDSKAKEKGLNMLQNFRAAKGSTYDEPSVDLSVSQAYDVDGYLDAMADGSLLARAFNYSKDPTKSFMESKVDSLYNEEAPLDLVRQAMQSLPGKESNDSNTSLMGILQRLEEALENQDDSSRKKLLYTFNTSDPLSKDDQALPESPSFENSRISRHRSICMENQLELNESEIGYYESIIEDLVEKLSEMRREKEDLQSICTSLGERLQKVGKDNEEKITELQNCLGDERLHFQISFAKLNEELSNCHEEVQRNRNELQLCKDYELALKAENAKLREELANANNELAKKINEANDSDSSEVLDRSRNQEIEELILNSEVLQLKLNSKCKMFNELSADFEKSKSKLDDALQEVNRLRLLEADQTVTQKMQQIDSDGEIELLRSTIGELEELLAEHKNKNEILNYTLAEEQEKLTLLQNILAELIQKQESSESMRESDEIQRLEEDIRKLAENLGEYQSENERLIQELQQRDAQLQDLATVKNNFHKKLQEQNAAYARLDAAKQLVDGEKERLTESVRILELKNLQHQTERDSAANLLEQLQHQSVSLQDAHDGMLAAKASLRDCQSDNDRLTLAAREQEMRIQQQDSDILNLQNANHRVMDELVQQKAAFAKLEIDYRLVSASMEKFLAQNQDLTEELRRLELEKQQQQIDMNSAIEQIMDEKRSINEHLLIHQSTNEALTHQVRRLEVALQEQNAGKDSTVLDLQIENARLMGKCENTELMLREQQSAIVQLEEEKRSLELSRQNHQSNCERLSRDFQSLELQFQQHKSDRNATLLQWEEEKCSLEARLVDSQSENECLVEVIQRLEAKISDMNFEFKRELGALGHIDDNCCDSKRECAKLSEELADLKANLIIPQEFDEMKFKMFTAERKAEFLSSDRARSFALSARVIGYLEGELIRFKSLCDHYRSCNAKLSNDVRELQFSVTNASEMEYKYHRSLQNEQMLTSKLKSADDLLAAKNKELKTMMVRQSECEMELERMVECQKNVIEQSNKHQIVECKISEEKYNLIVEELRQKELNYAAEITEISKTALHTENNLKLSQNLLKDTELECVNVRMKLSEVEFQLSEALMRLSLMEEQSHANETIHKRVLSEQRTDINSKTSEIITLRQEIESLKQQVFSAENQFVHSGEQFSKNLLQLSEEIDENRTIRQQLEEKNLHIEELQLQLQHLRVSFAEGQQQQLLLQTSNSQLTTEKSKMERSIQSLTEDKRNLTTKLASQSTDLQQLALKHEDLINQLESLKVQLVKVHQENITIKNVEVQLHGNVHGLTDENNFLRDNLENLSNEISKLKVQLLEFKQNSNIGIEKSQEFERALAMERQKNSSLQIRFDALSIAVENTEQVLFESLSVARKLSQKFGIDGFEMNQFLVNQQDQQTYETIHALAKRLSAQFIHWEPKITENLEMITCISQECASLKIRDIERDLEIEKLNEEIIQQKDLLNCVTSEFERLRVVSVEQERKHDAERSKLLLTFQELKKSLGAHWDVLDKIVSDVNSIVGQTIVVDNQLFGELRDLRNNANTKLELTVGLSSYSNYIASAVSSLYLKLSEHVIQLQEFQGENSQMAKRLDHATTTHNEHLEEKTKLMWELDDLRHELQGVREALSSANGRNDEYSQQLTMLSQELEGTLKVNSDLVRSLEEAESVCQELRSTVEIMQSNSIKWEERTSIVSKENENWKSKLRNADSQMEKLLLTNNRMKSEKEALENVRRSLELELERCREELISAQKKDGQRGDFAVCTFELEKLLSSIEHCCEICGLSGGAIFSKEGFTSGNWENIVRSKVHHGVLLLVQLQSKLREEFRHRKALESQVESSAQELLQCRSSLEALYLNVEEKEDHCVRLVEQLASVENRFQLKVQEINSLQSKNTELENELKLRLKAIESLKYELGQSQIVESQSKASFSLVTVEMEDRNNKIQILQEQVLQEKENRNSLLSELESRKAQIESINIKFEKVLQSLQFSETLLAEEKERRKQSEDALKQADLKKCETDESLRLQTSIKEKESVIVELHKQIASYDESASKQQLEFATLTASLHQTSSKLFAVEVDLASMVEAKNELQARYEAQQTELKLQASSCQQLQACLDTLQKSIGDDRRRSIELSISNRAQLESMLDNSNHEIESLKGQLRDAKLQLGSMIEELRSRENIAEHKQKQISVATSNNELLTNMNGELHTTIERLNHELKAKKTFIGNLLQTLKIIIVANKINVHAEAAVSNEEAINVYIDAIRSSVVSFQEESRNFKASLAKTQALQYEISTLRLQLNDHTHSQSLVVHTHDSKTPTDYDEKNLHLLNQLKLLQESLRIESAGKAAAIEDLKRSNKLLDEMKQQRPVKTKDDNIDIREIELMRQECKDLQEQVQVLMKNEVKLLAFIKQLDDKFVVNMKRQIDEHLAPVVEKLKVSDMSLDSVRFSESLTQEVRCLVLGNLVACISRFLIENYPQCAGRHRHLAKNRYVNGFSDFLIENAEIIFGGYEQELAALHRFVEDLMEKWSDAQSHMSELDRQVEEQMKLLYRVGKLNSSSYPFQDFVNLRLQRQDHVQMVSTMEREFTELRMRSYGSISRLAGDLTVVAAQKESLVRYSKGLERILRDHNIEVDDKFEWEAEKVNVDDAAVNSLVRSLIEADHDLLVAERKNKKSSQQYSHTVKPVNVETYLVNKRISNRDPTSNSQTLGLPIAKNSTGSSSLRISKSGVDYRGKK